MSDSQERLGDVLSREKKALEAAVTPIIREFQERTGLVVSQIACDTVTYFEPVAAWPDRPSNRVVTVRAELHL